MGKCRGRFRCSQLEIPHSFAKRPDHNWDIACGSGFVWWSQSTMTTMERFLSTKTICHSNKRRQRRVWRRGDGDDNYDHSHANEKKKMPVKYWKCEKHLWKKSLKVTVWVFSLCLSCIVSLGQNIACCLFQKARKFKHSIKLRYILSSLSLSLLLFHFNSRGHPKKTPPPPPQQQPHIVSIEGKSQRLC